MARIGPVLAEHPDGSGKCVIVCDDEQQAWRLLRCFEALAACGEILSLPLDGSRSLITDVPHAVAELREQSDSRGLTILMLQSKL